MRCIKDLVRDERGSQTLESALTMGLAVSAAIFVISWVSTKVHEGLNSLDTATTVVVREANYKDKHHHERH